MVKNLKMMMDLGILNIRIYINKIICIYFIMIRNLIRRNLTFISIFVFFISFCFIQWIKPGFLYTNDGALREFGIGSNKKTILPIWLFSLVLAILSYIFVLYTLALPKILF